MQGESWVDAQMQPLWRLNLPSGTYNRIYEAVLTVGRERARQLVVAVLDVYEVGAKSVRKAGAQ